MCIAQMCQTSSRSTQRLDAFIYIDMILRVASSFDFFGEETKPYFKHYSVTSSVIKTWGGRLTRYPSCKPGTLKLERPSGH